MTSEPASSAAILSPRPHALSRVIGGAVFGVLAGTVVIAAIQVGVAFDYQAENPHETWGQLLWGSHHLVRIVASVLATSVAAFFAGVAAREGGGIAAMGSTVPSVLAWAWCALATWKGDLWVFGHRMPIEASNADRTTAVFLTLVSMPLALVVGRAAGPIGSKWAHHFDLRPYSLCGIRWYHYLWLPLFVYVLIVFNSSSVFYYLRLQLAAWMAGEGVMAIVPGLLSLGLIVSFGVTYQGLATAYQTLAGIRPSRTPFKDIVKYGCGFPAIGLLIQAALDLARVGVQGFLGWLSR